MDIGGTGTVAASLFGGDVMSMSGSMVLFDLLAPTGAAGWGLGQDVLWTSGALDFQKGAKISLDPLFGFEPVAGSIFDIAFAEDNSCEPDNLMSFFDLSFFQKSIWDVPVISTGSDRMAWPSPIYRDTREVLRLSVLSVAPVPLPASLMLYLSVLGGFVLLAAACRSRPQPL